MMIRFECLQPALLARLLWLFMLVSGSAFVQAGAPPQPGSGSAEDNRLDMREGMDASSHGLRSQTRPGATVDDSTEAEDNGDAMTQRIDINAADAAELAAVLPGIGPSKARAIVEWRQANGPFRSVEQLLEVPGIGPATLQNIRPYIHLGSGRRIGGLQRRESAGERAVIAGLAEVLMRAGQDRREALAGSGAGAVIED